MKNLIAVRFSMCGFSQQSYDRIHKFKFDRIRENIRAIVSRLRSSGYKEYIEIFFQVYQFNANELRECQRFANDLGVVLLFCFVDALGNKRFPHPIVGLAFKDSSKRFAEWIHTRIYTVEKTMDSFFVVERDLGDCEVSVEISPLQVDQTAICRTLSAA